MDLKSKIIIHNYTDFDDSLILHYVHKIVQEGKVSETKKGKQYCFVTRFNTCIISCDRNKDTYTFKVLRNEK